MNVREIVEEYLKTNGFDGLVSSGNECACLTDDLFPCCENYDDCEAGHRVETPDDPDFDWVIVRGKRGKQKEEREGEK